MEQPGAFLRRRRGSNAADPGRTGQAQEIAQGRRRPCRALHWATFEPAVGNCDDDLLDLDAALDKLTKLDPRKAELIKLRYFAGLTNEEAAKALGVSTSTADNDWAYARSWLRVELTRGQQEDERIRRDER